MKWTAVLHPSTYDIPNTTGSAPETTLDALCQLLRALLLRFPDGVLGLLQPVVAAAAAPPSNADATALAQVFRYVDHEVESESIHTSLKH